MEKKQRMENNIDFTRFVTSLMDYLGPYDKAFDKIQSALNDQGLKYDNGKIKSDKLNFKFEEGNWYLCIRDWRGDGGNFIKGEVYYSDEDECLKPDQGCNIRIGDGEKFFRLWAIDDAKPGDILAASDDSVFIFAGICDAVVKYYIAVTRDGEVQLNSNLEHIWEVARACTPATKEQKEYLLSSIKEVGYSWDSKNLRVEIVEEVKPEPLKLTPFETVLAELIIDEFSDVTYETEEDCDKEWIKYSPIAKEWSNALLDEAKKQLKLDFDKDLEQAYKNQDEVVYRNGFDDGKKEALENILKEEVNIDEMETDFRIDSSANSTSLADAYRQGIIDTIDAIRGKNIN